MSETNISNILFSISVFLIQILITIYVIYTIRYRKNFLTVNTFDVKIEVPNIINLVSNEKILTNAVSISNTRKFFLSNKRSIFSWKTLLRGLQVTKYVNIKTIKNTKITFKNPYGFLLIAGVAFSYSVFNILSTHKSISLVILSVMLNGLLVLLWYYLKGYYLILDNDKVSGLFCRSNEGLVNTLRQFDNLIYSENTLLETGTQQIFDNTKSEKLLQKTNDIVCTQCKSVITLEGNELTKEFFICPICSTKNNINQ